MQQFRYIEMYGGSIQRKSPISPGTVLCLSLSPKTAHACEREMKAHSLSSFLKALIPFQFLTHILPCILHFPSRFLWFHPYIYFLPIFFHSIFLSVIPAWFPPGIICNTGRLAQYLMHLYIICFDKKQPKCLWLNAGWHTGIFAF